MKKSAGLRYILLLVIVAAMVILGEASYASISFVLIVNDGGGHHLTGVNVTGSISATCKVNGGSEITFNNPHLNLVNCSSPITLLILYGTFGTGWSQQRLMEINYNLTITKSSYDIEYVTGRISYRPEDGYPDDGYYANGTSISLPTVEMYMGIDCPVDFHSMVFDWRWNPVYNYRLQGNMTLVWAGHTTGTTYPINITANSHEPCLVLHVDTFYGTAYYDFNITNLADGRVTRRVGAAPVASDGSRITINLQLNQPRLLPPIGGGDTTKLPADPSANPKLK